MNCVSLGVAARTDAAEELLHGGQAFLRRIDRAADQLGRLAARRERPQGHDQVLQLDHRPSALDAHHAARRVGHPAFGRAGEHDVLAVGIVEHVADAEQAGQVASSRR